MIREIMSNFTKFNIISWGGNSTTLQLLMTFGCGKHSVPASLLMGRRGKPSSDPYLQEKCTGGHGFVRADTYVCPYLSMGITRIFNLVSPKYSEILVTSSRQKNCSFREQIFSSSPLPQTFTLSGANTAAYSLKYFTNITNIFTNTNIFIIYKYFLPPLPPSQNDFRRRCNLHTCKNILWRYTFNCTLTDCLQDCLNNTCFWQSPFVKRLVPSIGGD